MPRVDLVNPDGIPPRTNVVFLDKQMSAAADLSRSVEDHPCMRRVKEWNSKKWARVGIVHVFAHSTVLCAPGFCLSQLSRAALARMKLDLRVAGIRVCASANLLVVDELSLTLQRTRARIRTSLQDQTRALIAIEADRRKHGKKVIKKLKSRMRHRARAGCSDSDDEDEHMHQVRSRIVGTLRRKENVQGAE